MFLSLHHVVRWRYLPVMPRELETGICCLQVSTSVTVVTVICSSEHLLHFWKIESRYLLKAEQYNAFMTSFVVLLFVRRMALLSSQLIWDSFQKTKSVNILRCLYIWKGRPSFQDLSPGDEKSYRIFPNHSTAASFQTRNISSLRPFRRCWSVVDGRWCAGGGGGIYEAITSKLWVGGHIHLDRWNFFLNEYAEVWAEKFSIEDTLPCPDWARAIYAEPSARSRCRFRLLPCGGFLRSCWSCGTTTTSFLLCVQKGRPQISDRRQQCTISTFSLSDLITDLFNYCRILSG